MSKEIQFTIDNTGGITHAELKLRAGVNVLRGRNGAGKTSAIDAVVRASGGKASVQRKDGAEVGRVEGPGVSLTIKGVVKAAGRAELRLADVGPLGRLIDPKLKDTKAAARERIRALVELLDLGVDEEKLLSMCEGDRLLFADLARELDENAIDNLLEASEKLRHITHARARDQEDLAGAAQREVEKTLEECRGILEAVGGADGLSAMTPDEAALALEGAVRTHDRKLRHCEMREAQEKKQTEIRASIGTRPDHEGALKELAGAAAVLKDRGEELEELEKRIAELRASKREAEAIFEAADRRAKETEKALEEWGYLNQVLEEKIEGPTRSEVELYRKDIDKARELVRIAGLTQTFKEREKAHDTAVVDQEKAEERAKRYRELAAAIPGKLGAFLAEAGAEGLTVYDGRLHVIEYGEAPRDFEHRCSTGERVRAALKVAAQVYGGRVLALDGDVWGALDPENRAAFAQAAKAGDICVITEEPAEGELRVELENGNGGV